MTRAGKTRAPGREKRQTHAFTLVLSGIRELNESVEDALYEAGCDDALVGMRNGVPFLDFDREAASLVDAIHSAIRDVERAGLKARVVRVEPDDLVSASEIARRMMRSRESIRQCVEGMRGPGGFPAPVSSVRGTSPIWRWAEVAEWFAARGRKSTVKATLVENARVVATVNSALEISILLPDTLARVWRALQRRGKRAPSHPGAEIVGERRGRAVSSRER